MNSFAELERIQKSYEERFSRRPTSFYSPLSIFMAQEVERHCLDALRQYRLLPLEDKKILDVGTGGGFFLRCLLKYGARTSNLFGVDFWEYRLADGHQMVPCLKLICADGQQLPFADASFDIVLQQYCFSSILDRNTRNAVGQEMLRVTKGEGAILSYDFRFKRPGDRDVHVIRKRELTEIFGTDAGIRTRACGAVPSALRYLAWSHVACEIASSLWPIKTHLLAVVTKTNPATR